MRRPVSMSGSHRPSKPLDDVFRSTAPTFFRSRPQSVFDISMQRHLTFSDFRSKRNDVLESLSKEQGPRVLFLDLSKNHMKELKLTKPYFRQHHSQTLQERQSPSSSTTESHQHFLRLRLNSNRRRSGRKSEVPPSPFFETITSRRSPNFFRQDFRRQYEQRVRATPIMQSICREQQSRIVGHRKSPSLRQGSRQLDLQNAVIGVRLG